MKYNCERSQYTEGFIILYAQNGDIKDAFKSSKDDWLNVLPKVNVATGLFLICGTGA